MKASPCKLVRRPPNRRIKPDEPLDAIWCLHNRGTGKLREIDQPNVEIRFPKWGDEKLPALYGNH